MKDQASFYSFQKKIFEYIKQTKDAQDADNEVTNRKMWAVCDLGIQIIMQRFVCFTYCHLVYFCCVDCTLR